MTQAPSESKDLLCRSAHGSTESGTADASLRTRPQRKAGASEKPGGRCAQHDTSQDFVDDVCVFRAFAAAGRRLADLHVNYEQQPEYPLERSEKEGEPLNWRVEKMRPNKDKTAVTYNNFLTLRGIPPETVEYRLGNRSALEWVIDQYQVSTHKRSGITNDPNRPEDEQHIVRLIGQVITVSLETVKIVKALPSLGLPAASSGGKSVGICEWALNSRSLDSHAKAGRARSG